MFGIEVSKKYFKNIFVNVVFSSIFFFSFYVKKSFSNIQNFNTTTILFFALCEFLICFFSCAYVCIIAKRKPSQGKKIFFTVSLWSALFFIKDVIVHCVSESILVDKNILFIIDTFGTAILLGIMILSLCQNIYNYSGRFLLFKAKNIFFFIKLIIYSILAFLAVCIAAFVPVNTRGTRTNLIIIPKEVTKIWETRIFLILLFFLIPLYLIVFIQAFEEFFSHE
ncbi:MAG: hypothetical protein IJP05_06630 [Oscillospiraceae bacterium]|nr:hypothetical protein [Oscillospiraceae bacterium]MBQ6802732.1 hypothetical protein [Oscillospiraceae bacterium]